MGANWGDTDEPTTQRPSRLHRVGTDPQHTVVVNVSNVDEHIEQQRIFKEDWIKAAQARRIQHHVIKVLVWTVLVLIMIEALIILATEKVWPW